MFIQSPLTECARLMVGGGPNFMRINSGVYIVQGERIPPIAPLEISDVSLTDGVLNLSVNSSATIYYLISTSAAQMTGANIKSSVIAETPDVFGTFEYTHPGSIDEEIGLAALEAGDWYLHVAAEDDTAIVAAEPFGFTFEPVI